MEREITLSSFSVKGKSGNRPGDFTTRFNPTLDLPNDTGQYYLAFNKLSPWLLPGPILILVMLIKK